jgi:chorismate synthase
MASDWLAVRRELKGRGPRMRTETEEFTVTAGLWRGRTNGGPLALFIPNRDASGASRTPEGRVTPLQFPRPGHVDLAAALKWKLTDATSAADMASGRLTAAYTLAGSVAAMLLEELGVRTLAHTVQVGRAKARSPSWRGKVDLEAPAERAWASPVLALDPAAGKRMEQEIDAAARDGDTVGGAFEVVVSPVPPGLGAPQPLWERMDVRLAAVLMGIPAVKAVAVGRGLVAGSARGSRFHDPISTAPGRGFTRGSNRAGGIEGGITNGEPVVVTAVVKPVPTLGKPLASVSLVSMDKGNAARVRSDVCAVGPAAVAGRGLVALVLADAILSAAGGDVLEDIKKGWR